MATAIASANLTNHMVPAISSSGVSNVTHFKIRQVPLTHPVQPLLSASFPTLLIIPILHRNVDVYMKHSQN
jgi:hypothetical protein